MCFILLLISCSFCLSFMSNTYSRYVAGTTGNIDMLFAKWQILVNDQDIANQNNASIQFTPTINTNDNIKDNTFAPTSEGYFDISIDPSNVDVSFQYNVSLTVNADDIPDLMVTRYAILDSDYQEGDTIDYTTLSSDTITNSMIFDRETQDFAFEPFTVRIYFEWIDGEGETMDNDDDTLVAINALEDDISFTVSANITFEQITSIQENENENDEEIGEEIVDNNI